ncbi:hypothetical protein [Bifidobacterium scardovii]|uniref:Uncharacterized protein n=1 Tax=Bifidobacterium scardovii TaxID=158787 RepID=A0A087DGM1_9BIFI|nr:hypothetical protein [Bifidobacterium scardovii]KFI94671.1 hypothetical protein BSCA_0723 [Bifidobacterium scardovii]MDK6349809.1 hypothetical protein [Bifidobacterium scardovii]MDU8982513.1 hypothetical protein [Bifidobacterium scardovii]DAE55492.1 MAG TPA: hypothetical protein [Caudoviricetes sp.]
MTAITPRMLDMALRACAREDPRLYYSSDLDGGHADAIIDGDIDLTRLCAHINSFEEA